VSSGPVSRILSAPRDGATISLDATSLWRSSSQPGSTNGPGDPSPLFGLAPGGVCTAALLPGRRCALTAPFQPYPSEGRAVCFCCTFRRLTPPRRYLAPLPGGVRTFLWEASSPAAARPAGQIHCRTVWRLGCPVDLGRDSFLWEASSGSGRTGRDSGWTDPLSHGLEVGMPGGSG
jgi:hypothetical protein